MLSVAIVGCGKMADQHAAQIRRIAGVEIVAVCDREPLMARQMSDRFQIEGCFTDVQEMLLTAAPDVVHVTTPPQSHFQIGRMCLEAGCCVYVEKPFAIDTEEAEKLLELAGRKNLIVTAGHNAQFTPAMVRMRGLVRQGYLGGKPVHMESLYCYDFGNAKYAKALLGDNAHWVRRLPGSLLQNIISHGISKIAEFLSSDNPTVIATGFTSPFLQGIGQEDIIDEVRVIIRDEDSTTAYFTFSSQVKPGVHQFRLWGPRRSLIVDDDIQVLIRMNDRVYKSYLKFLVPPLGFAGQYIGEWAANVKKIASRRSHLPSDDGLKTLIEAFYRSVEEGGKPPLPYREILLTSRIMDEIFAQLPNRHGIPSSGGGLG